MTMREYRLRMKAYNLRHMDEEYMIYLSAWVNREIEAKKGKGKNRRYVYDRFDKFYDLKKRENEILHKELKKSSPLIERYKEYMRNKNG